MPKEIWTTEVPKEEAFYWVKYRSGREVIRRPAVVIRFKDGGFIIHSCAPGACQWIGGPNHGGPEPKYFNRDSKVKVDKSLRFGPRLEYPD